MKISVIGLGFVGLTLAVVNATRKFYTIGIDTDIKKINDIKKGIPSFYEPGLQGLLKNSIKEKTIDFTNNFNDILKTDITFVTVGTPSTKTGEIELKNIKNAVNQITKILKTKTSQHTVVIKSTVVPTTTKKIISPKFKNLKNIKLIVNPEFLRESFAINDLLNPHLIVIGESKEGDSKILKQYYKKFYSKSPEIITTDFSTTEMIKYANNSFLATKISFINSIANICQAIPKTDVNTIAYAIGKDPRIGPLFLNSGPGFGGSCLPKDLSALIHFSKKIKIDQNFLKTVEEINRKQPEKIIKIINKMGVLKKGKTISVLGLSFKKNTDDIRESKSIPFVKLLLKNKINVKVHDPMSLDNFKKIFKNRIKYCNTVSECINESDCCVIMTGWDEYKKINSYQLKHKMKNARIIDAQRILDPKKYPNLEFKAIGLGD